MELKTIMLRTKARQKILRPVQFHVYTSLENAKLKEEEPIREGWQRAAPERQERSWWGTGKAVYLDCDGSY